MMPFVSRFRLSCCCFLILVITCVVGANERHINYPTITGVGGQCEARTINYITHTLPQLCLTNTWSKLISPSTKPSTINSHQSSGEINTVVGTNEWISSSTTAEFGMPIVEEAVATPFVSFEDWKEMMLQRTGQDPQEMRLRKSSEIRSNERSPPESGDSGLGEEGEISLTFDSYQDLNQERPSTHVHSTIKNIDNEHTEDAMLFKDGKATMHRSKDAGKTCKERFSYSSFDAGATILKASPDAKNSKAVLVENKDSYMLLECAAQNKYVIIELSDDILIDTFVIANFEFFSSMIRHFRISVSDRYPVKLDKWRDLGVFEAKNSRDIQPFLVQNPQIWAKYVRAEFLTHYGNEYYCPISLVRVHGSRMLDSWKDSETGREEESAAEEEDVVTSLTSSREATNAVKPSLRDIRDSIGRPGNISIWLCLPSRHPFHDQTAICPASLEPHAEHSSSISDSSPINNQSMRQLESTQYEDIDPHIIDISDSPGLNDTHVRETSLVQHSQLQVDPTLSSTEDRPASFAESIDVAGTGLGSATINASNSATKTTAPTVVVGKVRNSWTTTAAAASPTVQEGFFNAITKRLQQVESNLTLSLQYMEDQSRHLQDALQKAEQSQLSKLSRFLDDFNKTALAELHKVRDQYDQMWQSTVLALESQRDQSERDIVALSSRLNLLADEVVFQKRMAIIQGVLLLSCLSLVIFSRGVTIPYLAPVYEQVGAMSIPATSSQGHVQKSSHDGKECENNLSALPQAINDSLLSSPPDSASDSLDPKLIKNKTPLAEYMHPPSPMSSNPQDSSLYTGMHMTDREHQSATLRRGASIHQAHSRKPLPSLPEHCVPSHKS